MARDNTQKRWLSLIKANIENWASSIENPASSISELCGDPLGRESRLIKKPLFCSGSRVGWLCNDRGKSISVVHDLNCSKSPPPSMAVGKETTNGLLSYWHRQNQVFFFNWLVLVVTPIFKISLKSAIGCSKRWPSSENFLSLWYY